MTGLMAGSPSPVDQLVTLDNWHDAPFNRWGYLHARELVPTAGIDRGVGPVTELPRQEHGIEHVMFQLRGRTHTVGQMLADTQTDGYLVLHEGRLIAERYANGMTPATPHLLQSVSKSLTSALAGVLVDQGRLDPTGLVVDYVRELRGTSFEGCTVQHLLDMRAGTRFSEAYEDGHADIRMSEQVSGWRPRTTPGLPASLYEYMPSLPNAREHGQSFDYRSILTDVLGWVLERASSVRFAELFSREVWSRIGAERDGYVTVDSHGCALADGGICVTLRDLGRFGLLYLNDGAIGGQQVVSAEWVRRLSRPDGQLSSVFGGALSVPGVTTAETMYHDQWWILDPTRGIHVGLGIHGQLLLIHRPSQTVIVKLSTQPKPVDRAVSAYQLTGSLAICDALAAGSL